MPTPQRDYARHEVTFLDWTYTLTGSYEPPDLVSALDGSAAGPSTFAITPEPGVTAADLLVVKGKPGYEAMLADDARALVRRITYPDLARLRDDARAAGHPLVIVSAHRSYAQQVLTFNYWVEVGGYEQALRTSARPGHSEHQLGTTLDFGDGSAAPWEYVDWAATPTGGGSRNDLLLRRARSAHAKQMRAAKLTEYAYEPWHYRWVGRDVAARVMAGGLALREFQTGIR